MPLSTLLYRCPICGTDPVHDRSEDRVECTGCSARFEPAPPTGDSRIRVHLRGEVHDIQAAVLNRRIERMGGAETRALGPQGKLQARARVQARVVSSETPLRFRDRLLGFVEQLAPVTHGELVLDGNAMEFRSSTAAGKGAPGASTVLRRWRVDEIESLQTSSSSVQISVARTAVIVFRFPDDSVRRWDDLIRRAVQARWDELGRGRIAEFQPRIRGEA